MEAIGYAHLQASIQSRQINEDTPNGVVLEWLQSLFPDETQFDIQDRSTDLVDTRGPFDVGPRYVKGAHTITFSANIPYLLDS